MFAIEAEGALHLDDLMNRRTRIGYEYSRNGAAAVHEVAAIAQAKLGWSKAWLSKEIQHYNQAALAYESALDEEDDAAASHVRLRALDLIQLHRR